ncbi:large ribosomal subunit protein mL40 [Cylas formicarius]|uniref:large ribosomal subunit protein mL40 n=1 Tax=Cylas formicarius TaxID=197179 RepID=UPI002958B86F|nr:large ribosomal subunit protein mL40 [Cylas formicarius]
MTLFKKVASFYRFANISSSLVLSRSLTTSTPLLFQFTPCLLAEPLKKKKRIDPAILKAREERRKKKLERQIRRLEKNTKQYKPIDECEVPLALLDEKTKRQREITLSPEILDKRVLLEQKWCSYKREQHLSDLKILDRLLFAQQYALDELRKESETLYQQAIQIDSFLIPYKSNGPTDTPPIENYDQPDGEYQDISKKWE